VFSIYRDSAGTLWIGTASGLNKFDMINNRWTLYTRKDGLPNNFIYGVLEERPAPGKPVGNLWMSTNKGLSRFNPETGEFKNYDISDGLQSNEFNAGAFIKSRNGLMFFGGINGFNVFDPHQIKENLYVPPVVLTDFQIFNKSVPIRQADDSPLKKSITEIREIDLTYRENSFSFGFAALNYISPEKNRYAYMLEGFNRDWILLEKRQLVTYTNVPPGQYIFKVEGSNNDGIWNEKGASVAITISPPFWNTWWFRLLMIVLFLGIFIFLHKMRTTNIRHKLRREQLEKELKLKADFTAMLVHDLRSPLTSILGYSNMLEEMPENVDINRAGKVIARSSEKMMTLINDMLDLSKFEAGKMTLNRRTVRLFEIVTEIVEVMAPLLDRKEINLVWEPDVDTKEEIVFIDPERIGQVVNNLLSNAIKFVASKGTILIRLSLEDIHFLELSVTDDGPGVAPANRKYLFDKYAQLDKNLNVKSTGLGLAVSKLIIEAHGGTIGFRPGIEGKGSTFYFRLPCVKE
jgi:signal transduction histidine kinase